MSTDRLDMDSQSEELVNRILLLLRAKLQEQGMSQLDVQEALGWGRTYISQLFRKQKAIRFDQVFRILEVIEIEPKDFFAELFELPIPSQTAVPTRRERRELDAALRRPKRKPLRDVKDAVSYAEFNATIKALVYYTACNGTQPVPQFLSHYHHELEAEDLLLEDEDDDSDDPKPPKKRDPTH